METWKPVLGWKGYYEVSDMGRIRSLPRPPRKKKVRMLKPSPTRGGYLMVILSCNHGLPGERQQTLRMNRVVLEAFTGIKHKDPRAVHAAHKNGIRDDNRLENLYWATYAENFADKVKHGRIPRGDQSKRAKLTEAQAKEILRRCARGEHPKQIALDYPVGWWTIESIKRGDSWAHLRRPDQESKKEKE